MAEAEKALGNEKFKVGDYPGAIEHFSKAISLEASHVLYSNRSACYCALRKCAACHACVPRLRATPHAQRRGTEAQTIPCAAPQVP
jgi:hypothetical protein